MTPVSGLSIAAKLLAGKISELSEEHYVAGWSAGCEWTLWDTLTRWRDTGDPTWCHVDISGDLPTLDWLQRKSGGWVWWRNGVEFVPEARWRGLVEIRRGVAPCNDNERIAKLADDERGAK